jgi:hypothetical protein
MLCTIILKFFRVIEKIMVALTRPDKQTTISEMAKKYCSVKSQKATYFKRHIFFLRIIFFIFCIKKFNNFFSVPNLTQF